MTKEIENFVALLQAREDQYCASEDRPRYYLYTFTIGKKYAKVYHAPHPNYQYRSIYCFIDLATGGILKPASFSAPAKHFRGNILGVEPLAGCNRYSVDYRN